MPKVKIVQLPKAKSGTNIQIGKGISANYKAMPYPYTLNPFGKEETSINNTLRPIDREDANIEAEKGEMVMIPGKGGIPETYKVGGDRHSEGGTPLNLPEESFVFSDTNNMKIKDPEILKQFNMSKSKTGYTPAQIAKKYDTSKWQNILATTDAEKLNKETAEKMIANSNLKLGKLALIQESAKSFPTGIPKIAFPYMESMGIDPQQLLPQQQQPQISQEMMQQRDGGSIMDKLQQLKMGGSPSYKVKILSLPKAQNGTQVKKWSVPANTIVAKNTEEAMLFFQDPKNKDKTIYISQPDGSYKKVTGTKGKVDNRYKEGTLDKTLSSINPDLAKGLDYTMQLLNSNPELKKDIVANAKAEIVKAKEDAKKDKTAYRISQSEYDDMLKMSDDDFLSKYKDLQTQNYYASSKLNKSFPTDKNSEAWDKGTPAKYEELVKDKFTPLSAKDAGIGQAFHIGLRNLKEQNPKKYKDILDNIELTELGTADEIGLKGNPRVSKIDGWVGNTTIRQLVKPAENLEVSLEDVNPDADIVEKKHLNPVRQDGIAPWWLQDQVKIAGAAGDFFRVKKYNPWQATPDTKFIDPTFYDPTRELAANSEQSNIGTNAIAAFSNPQAFNARYKQIQGNTANNAANMLAKYNNLNVGMANHAEESNTNIYNQASERKAGLSTQLFDKYTIVNQQFENAKNMARQNLRQSYIDAVTNRAKSQALNSLYPNYQHDPSSGGMLNYIDTNEELRADNSTSELDSKLAMVQKIKNAYPDWTPEEIGKFITGYSPSSKNSDLEEKQRVFNNIYGQ